MRTRHMIGATVACILLTVLVACSSSDGGNAATKEAPYATTSTSGATATDSSSPSDATSAFMVEVWADNWMAVSVDGTVIGEDSVPITTERSFNAETFEFAASFPFTIAIEAKDYQETHSGLEYIGTDRQQMGDGGLIAQVTDLSTGKVVATTDADWSLFVVNRAPLNTECEAAADPDATCEYETVDVPDAWSDTDFDDSDWDRATEWTADDVAPKDGYDEIAWDDTAHLIWGDDLYEVNTILVRSVITG